MQGQLLAFLLPASFESDEMMSPSQINTAWVPSTGQIGGLRSRFFRGEFFRIAGTSEAETSVSGKAECLLAIGEDRKSKLFR